VSRAPWYVFFSVFEMTRMKEFVVSDLIPCVNLKYLDIGYTTVAGKTTLHAALPYHSIQLNELLVQTDTA
jgi:hypothetical protein